MAMAGDGPWAVAVMWICVCLTFVFVLLRIYTRALVVQNYGVDDHVYNFAFVLLLVYTIMTTIAAHYGFGQNMYDIPDIEDLVRAILFEAIGQTFAVVGMAVAKWSLGLFLLRLVTETWHKVAIWITMASLMAASISVCFVFWLQCSPPAYLYDRRIPGGYCYINTTPVSFTLCILCVLADFFFALFPWLFLWNLNMNQREKVVIAASMSLGLIAGACGIKRTIEVPGLVSDNYLKDTVGLIVWSAAEIAVTMICIGIPVCRPLYKSFLNRLTSSFNSSGYKKHNTPSGSGLRMPGGKPNPKGLRTIGGGTMPGREHDWDQTTDTEGRKDISRIDTGEGSSQDGDSGDLERGVPVGKQTRREGFKDVKLGINGPFNKSKVTSAGAGLGLGSEGTSEEEILGASRHGEYAGSGGASGKRDSKRKSESKKDAGRETARTRGGEDEDIELGQVGVAGSPKEIHVTETWRVTVS